MPSERRKKLKKTEVFSFDIRTVYSHCAAKAQRYALHGLFPPHLRGALVERLPDEDYGPETRDRDVARNAAAQIAEALLFVQQQWRTRAAGLRAEGWKKTLSADSWYYVMNCPPVGVATNHNDLRTCRNYYVCPFCWARQYARDLYYAVEHACFGHNRTIWLDRGLRKEHAEEQHLFTDLLVVTDTCWYPMTKVNIDDVLLWISQDRRPTMFKQRAERRHQPVRWTALDEFDFYGAFHLSTVEPALINDRRDWAWQRTDRVLALVNPGTADPQRDVTDRDFQCSRQVRRLRTITRENIAIAAGMACTYPEYMLKGLPTRVLEIMEGRASRGAYMSSTFGLLRNRSKRKRGQSELNDEIERELTT